MKAAAEAIAWVRPSSLRTQHASASGRLNIQQSANRFPEDGARSVPRQHPAAFLRSAPASPARGAIDGYSPAVASIASAMCAGVYDRGP